MVVFDRDHEPDRVLQAAFELADTLAQPTLHLLLLCDGLSSSALASGVTDDLVSLVDSAGMHHSARRGRAELPPHDTRIVLASDLERVLERCKEVGATHVVLGQRRRSKLWRVFRTSLDEELVQRAHCVIVPVSVRRSERDLIAWSAR